MPDDLITWLKARLDDDERIARAAAYATGDPGEWQRGPIFDGVDTTIRDHNDSPIHDGTFRVEEAEHIARWDPARVLAEIDAKRTRLAWFMAADQAAADFPDDPYYQGQAELAENVIKSDARPYADRPGYQESWRP